MSPLRATCDDLPPTTGVRRALCNDPEEQHHYCVHQGSETPLNIQRLLIHVFVVPQSYLPHVTLVTCAVPFGIHFASCRRKKWLLQLRSHASMDVMSQHAVNVSHFTSNGT
ncbi:hypothetical protein AVEN_176804-1 [Araneus ventricosus]|uniref:Uncharacterized protein n=1 Tax=Araneus ventricosus TaxID=182803 RepID=A0A4Y2VUG3_ARAVE|nr:hypothetical protein AVEN_81060-1 [Araneus ventricosus]GBO28322.1 hypothetical protein AVEN_176804-1 [Araneus ventricosus]